MSDTQSISEPSKKAILKRCCKNTCKSYVGSDCKGIYMYHKIEVILIFITVIMFIICGIMFAKLASEECPNRGLLFVFGGLAYCLPVTIFITLSVSLSFMYIRKVWIAAKIESRQSMYHQRLYPDANDVEFGITKSITNDGYTVRLYTEDGNFLENPHNDL